MIAVFVFIIILIFAGLYKYHFQKNNKPDNESPVIENAAFDNIIDISPREGDEQNYPCYETPSDYAQLDSSRRVTDADSNYQGLLIHNVDPELTVPSDEDKIDIYTQLTKERDAGEPYTLLTLDRGEASVHSQLQVHAINPTNDIEHQENEHTYEEMPHWNGIP